MASEVLGRIIAQVPGLESVESEFSFPESQRLTLYFSFSNGRTCTLFFPENMTSEAFERKAIVALKAFSERTSS